MHFINILLHKFLQQNISTNMTQGRQLGAGGYIFGNKSLSTVRGDIHGISILNMPTVRQLYPLNNYFWPVISFTENTNLFKLTLLTGQYTFAFKAVYLQFRKGTLKNKFFKPIIKYENQFQKENTINNEWWSINDFSFISIKIFFLLSKWNSEIYTRILIKEQL